MDFELPQPKHQLTFYSDFGQRLTGADVVGGHTLVRPAVTQFKVGYEQPSILCGLCSRRQARPAHPAPGELNGMRAVGEALQLQGVSGLEPYLVRQARGVRGACVEEIISSDKESGCTVSVCIICLVLDSLSTSICVYASL